jgi:hypothetical protein
MKLFNPFRAHLARFSDGRYGVRCLSGIGWQFHGLQGLARTHGWWIACWDEYCAGTEEEARALLGGVRDGTERSRGVYVE